MRVVVGGVGARELVERDRDGWRPFSIDTRPHAGRTANVRFEVRTRDPGMRHFYFAGDTRSGGPR
jgi:hypothetical protein